MSTIMAMNIAGGICLILVSIPLYLKKIGPNGLYGFRVKKTMENPEIWYPVNRYGAGWLMLTGILTIVASVGLSFVPGINLDTYGLACLAVFTGAFIVAITMTMRYMNTL